ncbi:MAG: diaminopimelate decarboxylase [Nitritalea sp.]
MQAQPTHIQGVSLLTVADTFGTPVYVYDAEKIQAQVKRLQEAFKSVPLRIKYATKALSNLSILKLLRKSGTGADAVSIEEVLLCLEAGFAPEDIMYTPNMVSFAEIQQAVELGVMLNIDNLPMLEKFGEAYGATVPVCVRLNPHILAGGNAKISVGHIDSKFGISILQVKAITDIVARYQLQVTGLHVHTGSDILDAAVFLKGAEILFDAAASFPDLRFLDFGGGFKVAYKPGDIATDMEDIGEKVSAAFLAFCERYGRKLELWFEPGKFLVSEAGFLLVRANVVKSTPASTFIGVDSGLNHLIRPMMYDAYHSVYNLTKTSGSEQVYTIVGYICETDTIAAERRLHTVDTGDILVIQNAGAYGFSMASNYNSRMRPAEVLIYEGEAHLIRKRETFEDLLRQQVVLPI